MQLENNLSFFVKIYFTSIIIEISKRDRVKIFKRSEQRQKKSLYINDSGKIRKISGFLVRISVRGVGLSDQSLFRE
jgi:hypothetical protein